MFNFTSSVLNLIPSALEQFELLTFPNSKCHFIKSLPIFFPREIMNNFSLSFSLIMFFLWSMFDLKEIEEISYKVKIKFNPETGAKVEEILEKQSIDFELFSILTGLNRDLSDTEDRVFVYWNNELKYLTEGSMFLIFKLINYIETQIFSNLPYFKPEYINFVLVLFAYLFMFNFYGMIPFSLTLTSYFVLTLNLSGMVFFGNLLIGLKTHRLFFFKFFIPQGVKGPLLILMVVIELISYAARLFSMAIRLFANMLSGHALVKILSGLIFLTFEGDVFMGAAAILSNLIILVVVALEFVVAALQTYVFTVLSVIYINEAILLH